MKECVQWVFTIAYFIQWWQWPRAFHCNEILVVLLAYCVGNCWTVRKHIKNMNALVNFTNLPRICFFYLRIGKYCLADHFNRCAPILASKHNYRNSTAVYIHSDLIPTTWEHFNWYLTVALLFSYVYSSFPCRPTTYCPATHPASSCRACCSSFSSAAIYIHVFLWGLQPFWLYEPLTYP